MQIVIIFFSFLLKKEERQTEKKYALIGPEKHSTEKQISSKQKE